MINHNLALYALLDRTLSVNAYGSAWVANYTEGDLFELSKKLNDSKTKYPIIWLQSGYSVERNTLKKTSTLRGCKFFFITLGSKHDRYAKRYGTSYDELLYPLLVGVEKLLARTPGFYMADTNNFTTFPFNDTAELNDLSKKGTTVTGDVWDALLLETSITVDDCAFGGRIDIGRVKVIEEQYQYVLSDDFLSEIYYHGTDSAIKTN